MPNPFLINQTVQPVGVKRGGYTNIGFLDAMRQRDAASAQKTEQAAAQQAMQADFAFALDSENPNDMAKFAMKYPGLSEKAQSAYKFTNDKTKAEAQKGFGLAITAKDENQAAEYLFDTAKQLEVMGANPENTIKAAQALRSGEMDLLTLQKHVAVTDPDTWNNYQKFLDSQKSADLQQGTGKMSGYAFNPETGDYKVNQQLMDKVNAAKKKGGLDAKTRLSINKDFTQLTKDTKLIRNTAQDLGKLATMKSGPASIAMVFKFMKALDPTSVVREGEFAIAEQSSGYPEAIRNMANKIMSGEKLGENQIKEFVTAARGLANSAITSSEVEIDSYLNTFEDTLTPGFKKSIRARIPKRFEEDGDKPLVEEVTVPPTMTATGADGSKLGLVNGQWVKI